RICLGRRLSTLSRSTVLLDSPWLEVRCSSAWASPTPAAGPSRPALTGAEGRSMRLHRIVLALLLSAAPAFAQGKSPVQGADSLRQAAPPPESLTRVSGQADAWRLRAQLEALRLFGTSAPLPSIEQFSVGNRVIPEGAAVRGPVGIKDGSLDVFGKIIGTALVIDGNLRLHPGAEITGDALAVRGRVINQGGSVSGEARSLETLVADGQAK